MKAIVYFLFALSLLHGVASSATKVGVAWPFTGTGTNPNLWSLAGGTWGSKISWIYTWSPDQDQTSQQIGLEFVPMLWGQKQVTDFQNRLNAGSFDQAQAILGFNEPERSDQANLSPSAAVALWNQVMINQVKARLPHVRLGAPAVSSDPSIGKPWLTQFLQLCTNCQIDFIPIHWYGSDPNAFISYVEDIHNTFGKNIWVTEWAYTTFSACNPSSQAAMNTVFSFMGQTSIFLDETASYVERYSWFGAVTSTSSDLECSVLITSNGASATALGGQYALSGHS